MPKPAAAAAVVDLQSRVVIGCPAVDPDALAQLRCLDEEGHPPVVPELVALFLHNTEARLVTMQALLTACDGIGLGRAAHSLKSASAHLGAFGMRDLCEQIEDVGATDRLHEADRLLLLLREEFKVVTRALRRIVA